MGASSRLRCPICGHEAGPLKDNRAFPFCSPQCKLVDLNHWLQGSYRVPGPPIESSELLESDAMSLRDRPSRSDDSGGDE
jgi:uncharacterized protein